MCCGYGYWAFSVMLASDTHALFLRCFCRWAYRKGMWWWPVKLRLFWTSALYSVQRQCIHIQPLVGIGYQVHMNGKCSRGKSVLSFQLPPP